MRGIPQHRPGRENGREEILIMAEFTEVTVEGRKVKIRSAAAAALPAYAPSHAVGKRTPRVDALEKVTGRAVFPTDVDLPNMAHVRFVRSARAHARVTSIDTTAASGIAGVLAIVVPRDLAGKALKDFVGRELPILTDEPRYFGEEILAICAETEDAARAASMAVRIEYDDLPFTVDPEACVKVGQFVGGGWERTARGNPIVYERGNVKKGFAGAARVFERTYRTAWNVHSSIEPHAAVATFEDGRWTVWESTQGVFQVREDLAGLLDVPPRRIRVIGSYMGGGFGGKTAAGKHTYLAAHLAQKLGRPVRAVHDRSEEFSAPYGRPPSIQKLKMGVRADGRLVAIEQIGIHATGAYEFGAEWGNAENMLAEMYACDNVRTESYAALTNTPPSCAMRAPGHAQAAFALEQMMDEIARTIGMDPVEFRLKNIPARDPESGRSFAGPKGFHGMAECLKKGAALFGWAKKKSGRVNDAASNIKRGIGVAATSWSAGGGPPASATLRMFSDGAADLHLGAADIGTGTRTALCQIAAEETGLRVEDIRIINADTDRTSYMLPSYGSLTLASAGPAVRRAAHACRKQILELAADVLESQVKGIVLAGGTAAVPETKKKAAKSVSIAALVGLSPSREIFSQGEREGNPDVAIKAYAAQFAAVSVDTETGVVVIDEFVAVNDSGRVVSPNIFESQQIGGVTMGLGMALFEDRVFDRESGRPLNPNWADYKIPTISAQPAQFTLGAVDVPTDANIIGAKGLGEPPIIPTAAAVANAIADAIGVRLVALPMSPKRVLDALAKVEP